MTTHPLVEYFRCPAHVAVLANGVPVRPDVGYFKFADATCYGRQAAGAASPRPVGSLVDVSRHVSRANGKVLLPFDLSEVLHNLRYERYPRAQQHRSALQVADGGLDRLSASSIAHQVYYFCRPALPVGIRKHLQRMRLAGWKRIPFPGWPVDATVETLMKNSVATVLAKGNLREFPFVWFWPNGAPACVAVTHDVEGRQGVGRADELMDLDDAFGIKSSFQLVPEARTSKPLLEQIRRRDFEVNVHDLNHDGRLFSNKALFLRRAVEINRYVHDWGCGGFRAGAMYRRQDWFAALNVAFDMSVPAVAHLEPQQGGCCTVMPYFVGDVLELPLTMTQDYSLFHVLRDYSAALWREQVGLILANHGLVSVIVHPDYLVGKRERGVYVELLTLLSRLRDERQAWVALPSEIDRWWRQRHQMRLVADGDAWRVEGQGADRARVAYARLEHGRVVYEVAQSQVTA
jgi:hypothetical protein